MCSGCIVGMERDNHGNRPLAVVVGSSANAANQRTPRASELRRHRDSLRQVDRNSADPEDLEKSKKRLSLTSKSPWLIQ